MGSKSTDREEFVEQSTRSHADTANDIDLVVERMVSICMSAIVLAVLQFVVFMFRERCDDVS